MCAAEKSPLKKARLPPGASLFLLLFLFSCRIHFPGPDASLLRASGSGAERLPARGCIKGDIVRGGAWEEAQRRGPAPAKSDPMGCGSDGGVPLEPSWAAPPEKQTPKGGEMNFPRKLRFFCVVDAGGRLPRCLARLGSCFSRWGTLMGVPFRHRSSHVFGGSSPSSPEASSTKHGVGLPVPAGSRHG